jgi:ATP-dependent DNA helicase RecG
VDDDPLAPLFSPLTALYGIGPAIGSLIAKAVGGERVIDLLFHLPGSYVDRRERSSIGQAQPGRIATLLVEVMRVERPESKRQPWRVVVTDGTSCAELVFFKFSRRRQMPVGAKLLVSGKLELFGTRRVMTHPEYVVAADRQELLPLIEPVWRLTGRLWPRQVAAAMAGALAGLPSLPEWHNPALLRDEKWPPFVEALRALHAPSVIPGAVNRARLAYDEILSGQVALAVVRGRLRAEAGRSLTGDGLLRAKALSRFGYALTSSQRQALAEIDADLESDRRMLRLLQGDVGSGKTVVALLAMLRAVEAGKQAALMAPSEVLAKQHHNTLSRLSPAPVALLTGGVKGRARADVLHGLKEGSTPLVVGTHALFQEGVKYRELALAVIDEQHRFGVDQRRLLGGKGELTDVLVMTATPIPRTLLLTQWGETDVSRLTERPPGRGSVRTSLHALGSLPQLVDAVGRKLGAGARVYWVCPLVAESEATDSAAAEARFTMLRERFGDGVGLAHGRQDATDRDAMLAAFAAGECRLLVATTVVEVGIDVPQASVMVVERAERFGLAQLHQLRGRVGRGSDLSFCLLLHEDAINDAAKRRLRLLRDTDDGFVIADQDFRLRGGGDVLGTKQSGQPGFRLADPIEHEGLLHKATRDAALLLQRDPHLVSDRGRAVRLLLRLFERTAALRTLLTG